MPRQLEALSEESRSRLGRWSGTEKKGRRERRVWERKGETELERSCLSPER